MQVFKILFYLYGKLKGFCFVNIQRMAKFMSFSVFCSV